MRQYNPIYPSIRKIQNPDSVKIDWIQNTTGVYDYEVTEGDSFNIAINIVPSNAVNKRLTWSYKPMDNSLEIISLDRNHSRITIIPHEPGPYYITYRTTDGSNISQIIRLNVLEREEYIPMVSFKFRVTYQGQVHDHYGNSTFNIIEDEENNPIKITVFCDPDEATFKAYNWDFQFVSEEQSFKYNSVDGLYEGTLVEGISFDTSNPEEVSVLVPSNLVSNFTLKATSLDGTGIENTFTGVIEKLYIAIQDITVELQEDITKCDVGDIITCVITVMPPNATEWIENNLDIVFNTSIDVDTTSSSDLTSGIITTQFTTKEEGLLTIECDITSSGISGFSKHVEFDSIIVGKVIIPMTEPELAAHLEERRYENLISSAHFESLNQLSEYVAAKDFHDIYIGDYIEVNIPWIYWDSSSSSMKIQFSTTMTKLRIVDINYLLNKDTNITANHLVLWPDTIIGAAPMSNMDGDYDSELIQINGQPGRGYYSNYMINIVLPYIRGNLSFLLGSTHILNYKDSVPVYYSSTTQGTLNQVTYQAQSNTSLRLPNAAVYGDTTGTDKSPIWNKPFRLLQTDPVYGQKETPSGATISATGTLTTDINIGESTIQALSWQIRNGNDINYTQGIDEGNNPICPILIFG